MRISTGPYKPGDDWTGYFIRGDQALGEAGLFRSAARMLREIATHKLDEHDADALKAIAVMLSEWSDEFVKVYEGN